MKTTSFLLSGSFFLKLISRSLLAAALSATSLLAQTAAAPAEKSPADLAHEEFVAVATARPLDGLMALQLSFDAFQKFPTDARFTRLLTGMPLWAYRLPETQRPEFRAELSRRIAAALGAPGLSDESWEVLTVTDFNLVFWMEHEAASPDIGLVRAKLDALAARRPQARALLRAELDYVRMLDKSDPAAATAHLQRLATGPHKGLAAQATGELRVRELRHTPLEMKFTAADGREVDLAKLRGKVVLIDFWATWCGPCVAELPHLKRVYEIYRDKGFEIVGIAFENARIAATDTEEQKASKLNAARTKLLKFAAAKGAIWPHHFDGKFMDNEFGRRYSVRGLPTLFLLGRDGRLIGTDIRGAKLDAELERLFAD